MSAPPIVIPPAMPLPPIQTLTAPLVFGELFSIYLFGILSAQVYIYYLSFPKDANYIKAFVYGIFTVELAANIMCVADAYHWFAAGFGNTSALDDVQLSPVDTPLTCAIVASAVQMFYCYRIYSVNKKAWWVTVIVAVLTLAQTGAGFYSAIIAEQVKLFSIAEAKGKVATYILFIATAVADVVIATTMIVLLMRSRQNVRAVSQRTTSTILKIMNLIVETNLASASVAIITLVLFVSLPGTNYFTCPSLVLGRIYSNSVLLILNNRQYLTTNPSSNGLFRTSRTDYTSNTSYGYGHSKSGTTSVRIELDTVTDTYQGV